MHTETKKTKRGTPLSSQWDEDWAARVEAAEDEEGERICGAHAPDWTPCTLPPDHSNGRCRYHGGAAGIGAPFGNRNALVHGLYSRRLRQCSATCPKWDACPMPTPKVAEMPAAKRPHCFYEQDDYDTLIRAFREEDRSQEETEPAPFRWPGVPPNKSFGPSPSPNPYHAPRVTGQKVGDILLHHHVAMFHVMLNRAEDALDLEGFTQETHADGKNYHMRSGKIGALLQAYIAIARETRHWVRLLTNKAVRAVLGLSCGDSQDGPSEQLSWPDMMKPILERTEDILEDALKEEAREREAKMEAKRRNKRTGPEINGLDPQFAT